VLPNSGQHYDIEADPESTEDAQFRKLIVDPADSRVGMKGLPLRAHTGRRLNGDYVVSLIREPSGVTSRPSADVEDRAGRIREEAA
jgi:hypothetical protein